MQICEKPFCVRASPCAFLLLVLVVSVNICVTANLRMMMMRRTVPPGGSERTTSKQCTNSRIFPPFPPPDVKMSPDVSTRATDRWLLSSQLSLGRTLNAAAAIRNKSSRCQEAWPPNALEWLPHCGGVCCCPACCSCLCTPTAPRVSYHGALCLGSPRPISCLLWWFTL